MSSTAYRQDIDGLRAVAVLPVVFYHAGAGFTGGFVGVDVFFVISGFLITGLLVRDLGQGSFSLLEFWHRRVRRIFPALYAMVLAVLIVGGLLMIPADYKELGQSAIAQCFLGANIFFWDDTGYFAAAAETKPLLHTWSLAVEEQFYVLFPLVLVALWKKGQGYLLRALLIVMAVSFVASLPGPAYFQATAFYWLPTRAWELLCGAVLVFLPVLKKSVASILAPLGLGMILLPVFMYSTQTPFPGWAAIPPCQGASLLIWSGSGGMGWVHRMLSWRPLVFVGLISYSLYLWHWPVLVFSRKFLLGAASPGFVAFQIVLSMMLAVLSWRFVETPFRAKTCLPERGRMLKFGAACAVATALGGILLSATKGLPVRLPASVRLLTSNPPELDYKTNEGVSTEDVRADRVPLLGDSRSEKLPFLLWGDSHAMTAHPVFDVLGKEKGRRGYMISRRGTAPVLNTWRREDGTEAVAFNAATLDFVKRHHVRQVFLVSYWAGYTEPSVNGKGWFLTDDAALPESSESAYESFERQLKVTISALRESGAEVFILRQVPEQNIHVPDILSARLLIRRSIEALGSTHEAYRLRQQRVNDVFDRAKGAGVHVIDTASVFMDEDSRTILVKDGRATFHDEAHLTVVGSMLLRPLLEPIFSHQSQEK